MYMIKRFVMLSCTCSNGTVSQILVKFRHKEMTTLQIVKKHFNNTTTLQKEWIDRYWRRLDGIAIWVIEKLLGWKGFKVNLL